jgi:hypothetical protein
MILEALVTTLNADGTTHLAPMGPRVDPEFRHILLRPFPTSHTYANLKRSREGVLHVTDDVLLLARAALGKVGPFPRTTPAERVNGVLLADACRAHEFVVREIDDREQRLKLDCEVVHTHTFREFFGFNRAKHAVVEAAILATRFRLLPADEIAADFHRLRVIVDKTAGPREQEAMAFLEGEWVRFREGG